VGEAKVRRILETFEEAKRLASLLHAQRGGKRSEMENTADFSIFVVHTSCRGLVKFIMLKEKVYFVELGGLSVMTRP
jgi:hypothetical protein